MAEDVFKQLQGTHGTCQKHAMDIQRSSFSLRKGRLGRGAYFWRQAPLADHLAEGWYRQRYSEQAYKHVIGDKKRAIITVAISCPELEHLDMEAATVKDGLMRLAIDKGLLYDTDEDVAALNATFVAQVEAELETQINVIEVRLAPPKPEYVPKYSIKSFGAPIVYVVRNASYIKILKVA